MTGDHKINQGVVVNTSKVININISHQDINFLVAHDITNSGEHLAEVGFGNGTVGVGIEESKSLG